MCMCTDTLTRPLVHLRVVLYSVVIYSREWIGGHTRFSCGCSGMHKQAFFHSIHWSRFPFLRIFQHLYCVECPLIHTFRCQKWIIFFSYLFLGTNMLINETRKCTNNTNFNRNIFISCISINRKPVPNPYLPIEYTHFLYAIEHILFTLHTNKYALHLDRTLQTHLTANSILWWISRCIFPFLFC